MVDETKETTKKIPIGFRLFPSEIEKIDTLIAGNPEEYGNRTETVRKAVRELYKKEVEK